MCACVCACVRVHVRIPVRAYVCVSMLCERTASDHRTTPRASRFSESATRNGRSEIAHAASFRKTSRTMLLEMLSETGVIDKRMLSEIGIITRMLSGGCNGTGTRKNDCQRLVDGSPSQRTPTSQLLTPCAAASSLPVPSTQASVATGTHLLLLWCR